MLRAFRIEAARLMRRTAHQELAGGNADHFRAVGTFAEFAVGLGLRSAQEQHSRRTQKAGGDFHQRASDSISATSISTSAGTVLTSAPSGSSHNSGVSTAAPAT